MGFFKKLAGAIDKLDDVKELIEKVAENVQKDDAGKDVCRPSENVFPVKGTQTVYVGEYNTSDRYFAALITEANFPGYSIATNVHAQTFDSSAHPSCYPVSYLFSDGSGPVLAVLVMNTNQYRSMIARGTYKVLDDKAIPYIRFYKGMKNEESYVLDRIRDNLK
ncbi:MAG: hypothetical protein E7218_03785 [Anaerofustis stercorihominis]|nr:hypothetical protein [Anaerofustis stercorihominis]